MQKPGPVVDRFQDELRGPRLPLVVCLIHPPTTPISLCFVVWGGTHSKRRLKGQRVPDGLEKSTTVARPPCGQKIGA